MAPFSSIILKKSDRLREGFRMGVGATGQVTVELGREEGGILVERKGEYRKCNLLRKATLFEGISHKVSFR